MTYDLIQGEAPGVLRGDVCILGAGAAGCYLARTLVDRGWSVLLVDAGGDATTSAEALDMIPKMPLGDYSGAHEGRAFGLGGSTARWGGALIPHGTADLRPADDSFAEDWQHIVQVARTHAATVQTALGRKAPVDFDTDVARLFGLHLPDDSTLRAQSTLGLPFRRKNLRTLLPDSPRLTVVLNAACAEWETSTTPQGMARITAAQLRSTGGSRLRTLADRFIVTAGAIESARLLLELEQSAHHALLPQQAETGQGLSDHLSAPIAGLNLTEAIPLGPRFQGSWMRSLRFVKPDAATQRGFVHVVFHHESAGLRLVQAVLRGLQERRLPDARMSDAIRGARDIVSVAWARLACSRLHIPRNSRAVVQLDMEQARNLTNRIALTDQRDAFGRLRAELHWRIADTDLVEFARLAASMRAGWPAALPRLRPLQGEAGHGSPYGAYHPAGTTRIGRDAGAVLTHDLQVRGSENLWSVSTGLLPTAGTANPTFTMLCFAQHLADQLAVKRPIS